MFCKNLLKIISKIIYLDFLLIFIVKMDDKSSIFAKIFKLRDRKIKKQFIFRQLLFDNKKCSRHYF